MHYTIGIDPGINGAIAIITGDDCLEDVLDIPTLSRGAKGRREIDAGQLYEYLKNYHNYTQTSSAIIELQQFIPPTAQINIKNIKKITPMLFVLKLRSLFAFMLLAISFSICLDRSTLTI